MGLEPLLAGGWLCGRRRSQYGLRRLRPRRVGRLSEFKPLNWSVFKRLYVFASPRFFFGDNVPQTRYTFSFDPIGVDQSYGLIYDLPRNFQMRLTQHAKMDWLGKYTGNLGRGDLGGDGPYGQNLNVGVRYNYRT